MKSTQNKYKSRSDNLFQKTTIKYETFFEMYYERYPQNKIEQILRKKLLAVETRDLTTSWGEEERDQEIYQFAKELIPWDEKKAEARRKWDDQETKLRGIFEKTTDKRYHNNISKAETCHAIRELLKSESNQNESSTIMAEYVKFFTAEFKPTDSLLEYSSNCR